MERLDEAVDKPVSDASQTSSRRRLRWLRKNWDLFALLPLLLAAMPTLWFSPHTLMDTGTGINLIDDSWLLDTSFKASRGIWFGRDVAFTYGPLYQWLSSAPARWMGISMGAIYDSCVTLPLWCTFLFGYLTLNLLLPEQPAWKRFVLLLLLCVFWATVEGRVALSLLLFAVFLRGWYALQRHQLKPVLFGCCSALLCAVAFLYSTDTGIYALAALLLSLAGVAWEGRNQSQHLRSYDAALLAWVFASLVLVIAINRVMATPLDFRFWNSALAIFSSYRWIEPESMSRIGKIHLLAVLLVTGGLFLVRSFITHDRQLCLAARSGFLLSGLAFAFLAMQSGLVRSDWGHIVLSSYVAVFLSGVVLFSFPSRIASCLAVLVALACSFMFGEPPSLATALRYNYQQLRNPSITCPPRFLEFDRWCYPDEFTRTLQITAGYVQQHSSPRDFMAVFPFQNIFGITSGRNVAGGVLQSYLVSGPRLSQIDIAGLDRAAAPVGLYLPDGPLSTPVDGISNFTRTPEVWLWMFRHYRAETEVVPGVFGLQRDDSRANRITAREQPVRIPLKSYPVWQRRLLLDLGSPLWPSEGADFVRLRLKVHYSLWWKLRKPARLVLEIERADSSDDLKPFLVQPNFSSEIWFYPWNDAELAHYFDADEGRWRSKPRPAITHLRLWVMPLDWVSVQPDTVEVQAADAVKFSMALDAGSNSSTVR